MTGNVFMCEVLAIDTNTGPLADFPPDINSNFFVDIVRFAMDKAPRTLELIFSFVVKQEEATQRFHVPQIATLFANICYTVNENLNAAVWLRSLLMKMNNLTRGGWKSSKMKI